MQVSDLLTLLLGGGFVATLGALFNGVKSLREGSRSKEKDTISSLIQRASTAEEGEEKANDRADFAMAERDYWRNWAGRLEYGMVQHGIDIPERPTPPQEKK